MLIAGVATPFAYNTNLVSPSEFHSWKDLLNPKWKGKLSSQEGLIPGAIPHEGAKYLELNNESYVKARPEAIDYVKSVMSR